MNIVPLDIAYSKTITVRNENVGQTFKRLHKSLKYMNYTVAISLGTKLFFWWVLQGVSTREAS